MHSGKNLMISRAVDTHLLALVISLALQQYQTCKTKWQYYPLCHTLFGGIARFPSPLQGAALHKKWCMDVDVPENPQSLTHFISYRLILYASSYYPGSSIDTYYFACQWLCWSSI